MVAANMSGKEKLPPMVIGKSLMPRCLKNVKNLPVEYTVNKKAWMTSTIFETWLRKIPPAGQIHCYCPAHPNIEY